MNKVLCIAHPHHLSPSPPVFEEPEDPSAHSFFSEIISSVSDVKFSHSGRYLLTRDYLTAKVWDLNMERKPLETYQVCEASRGTRSVCGCARPQRRLEVESVCLLTQTPQDKKSHIQMMRYHIYAKISGSQLYACSQLSEDKGSSRLTL